jgi:hypothetical protein
MSDWFKFTGLWERASSRGGDRILVGRAKAFRRRKRDKFKSVRLDVHDFELDAMVRHGLLPAEQRNDAAAIYTALGKLLERAVAALEAGRLPKVPG